MEPNLAPDALGAVHLPREHLIDPWSASLAYLKQAIANRAKVCRNAEVLSGRFDGSLWHLATKAGPIKAGTSSTVPAFTATMSTWSSPANEHSRWPRARDSSSSSISSPTI
ncbi:hypothetical protein EN797_024215 [Mesorhizobium sp. M2E.F.Ca.ET.154.01.1.1]|nr:hypothetical protein EN797_024215 [Mesorhizobium sp. M2E.F.Ca.ET.154.01.1.1]